MIIEETPIKMIENNDPVKLLHIEVIQNGVKSNYDFTGVTEVKFRAKTGVAVADTAEFINYSSIGGTPKVTVVAPATAGKVQVAITGADIPKPGVHRYRLDAIKSGKTETLMHGPFIVENV